MRRTLPILCFGLLLATQLAWGQAMDLAKQLPTADPKSPQGTMDKGHEILVKLNELGAAGIKQLVEGTAGPDAAKAWYALNGLVNLVARPGAETERLALANALMAEAKPLADAPRRNQLIQLLQMFAKDEAVPFAAGFLANDDSNDYAVRLLASIGSPKAAEALQQGLAGAKGRSQANIVRALGQAKVKAGAAPIQALAGDADPILHEAVLEALADLGDPASKDVLLKAAGSTGKLERARGTAQALRYARNLAANGQADAAAALVRDLLKARTADVAMTVDGNAALWAILGEKALPELMTALDTDNTVQRDGILETLAPFTSAALGEALAAKAATAKTPLKIALLKALAQRGDPQAAAVLREALKDPDKTVRLAAIDAAGWLLPAGPGILLGAMGTDQADETAAAALRLGQMSGEATVQALVLDIRGLNNAAQAKLRVGRLGMAHAGVAWRALGILVNDPLLGQDAAAALAASMTPADGKGKPPLTPDNRKLLETASGVADDATKAKIAALLGGPVGGPGKDTNVALNKPVFESGDHEADQIPEQAVDGQSADRDHGWWTPAPASITVNLKDTYRIDRVHLWTYWDGTRSYQYTIEVSMDNHTFSQVVDQSKNDKPSTEAGDELKFAPTDAKFVRLNMLHDTANASMHVIELQVFPVGAAPAAAAGVGGNLAKGKPVVGEPAQEQDHAPEFAVDGETGDPNVGWFAGGTPATLTVDLKEVAKIDTTRVWFWYEQPRYYQWKVEVSRDQKEWTQVVDRTKNELEVTPDGFVDSFAPVEARWVRLVVTKNSANPSSHVVEFQVFAAGTGPKAPPPPVPPKAVTLLPPPKPDADGFTSLIFDKDLEACGWVDVGQGQFTKFKGYEVSDDLVLHYLPNKGGKLMTSKEYTDFDMKFDFKLTKGANNGVGIRAPLEGDSAYNAMELQILDDRDPKYKDWLHDYQCHASVYGIVAAKRDLCKPVGEWNTEEIIAQGSKLKILVNGQVAVDVDLATVKPVDGKDHPGYHNPKGHVGFLGHVDECWMRNVKIREL